MPQHPAALKRGRQLCCYSRHALFFNRSRARAGHMLPACGRGGTHARQRLEGLVGEVVRQQADERASLGKHERHAVVPGGQEGEKGGIAS
jgi:hypothetical protein